MKIFLLAFYLIFSNTAFASTADNIENFIFIGKRHPEEYKDKLLNNKISGVQIVYNWKQLEISKDKYDFSKIRKDLNFTKSLNKKLWIQLQDRFFRPNDRLIPDYLLNEAKYHGGLASQRDNPGDVKQQVQGWVSKQWNDALRTRYQKLISELAKEFDGEIYGINLPETSIDINEKEARSKDGFSCDKYFNSTLENINFTRSVFKKSYVVQYANFWPCEWENDHKYMSRFFENAIEKNIGLGGPDIVPYRKAQMKSSYPFFNKYKNQLNIVAFAVQAPTRTYVNPKTKKRFTDTEFKNFAVDYLGVNIIFWSVDGARV